MSEQDEALKQAVGRGMAHRRASHRRLQRAEHRIKELEAELAEMSDPVITLAASKVLNTAGNPIFLSSLDTDIPQCLDVKIAVMEHAAIYCERIGLYKRDKV